MARESTFRAVGLRPLHAPMLPGSLSCSMRLLLVTWLSLGLAPGLAEAAQSAVHLASAGHLARPEAHCGDLGDQGAEHGCSTTGHNCGCCASQMPQPRFAAVPRAYVVSSLASPSERLASLAAPSPPFRPPIAS